MTPEGYKLVKEVVDGPLISPKPEEGEDVHFVRIISPQPEMILNCLAKARLLVHEGKGGRMTSIQEHAPRLVRIAQEPDYILFQDLNAEAASSDLV